MLEDKIKARLGELVFALTTMEEKIDVQQVIINEQEGMILDQHEQIDAFLADRDLPDSSSPTEPLDRDDLGDG